MGTDGSYYRRHTAGWVSHPGQLLVSAAGDRVALVMSSDQGHDAGFFPHLVVFRCVPGNFKRVFEVSAIVCVFIVDAFSTTTVSS